MLAKYGIGEIVFFLHNNKVHEKNIAEIRLGSIKSEIKHLKNGENLIISKPYKPISYLFYRTLYPKSDEYFSDGSVPIIMIESNVFKTKEDLLKSL